MAEEVSLKAPFPYFGGKGTVASVVWAALGQPKHYLEPFFGSGAVLLARPRYRPGVHVETVCDMDGFLANVWRALQRDPDEVARWCDWPVNHADLSARKRRLVASEAHLLERLSNDDEWYDAKHDAKLAGYWVWAASCWIGSGLTSLGQIPHVGSSGMGVHALGQIPRVSHSGTGVHSLGKRPHLSNSGMGVHALGKRPRVDSDALDVREPYNANIYTWMRALSERLRHVRVVCGDWTRICGGDWQDNLGPCGIFLDPPYGVEDRDNHVYQHDSTDVAQAVGRWAMERGARASYRVVLAGYDEHEWLLERGWTLERWQGNGGYANQAGTKDGQGKNNRLRETLYFSPYCLKAAQRQLCLPGLVA